MSSNKDLLVIGSIIMLAVLWQVFALNTWSTVTVGTGLIVILAQSIFVYTMLKRYISTTTSHTIKTCGCNCGHNLHGYQGKRKTSKTDEIVIFVAKDVVTMNSSWPSCTAVATQRSRIVGVGDLKSLMSVWSKGTVDVRIDRSFQDLVIVPGFIDPHIHPLIGGTAMSLPCIAYHDTPNPFGADYPGCCSKRAAIERLQIEIKKKIKAEKTEPKTKQELVRSCMIAWGWDSVAMGEHLNRDDLDQVSTIRPVVVWDCSMHLAYLNTCALDALDLNKNKHKISKTNGVMLNPSTGELNGQFLGLRAMPCTYGICVCVCVAIFQSKHLFSSYKQTSRRSFVRYFVHIDV